MGHSAAAAFHHPHADISLYKQRLIAVSVQVCVSLYMRVHIVVFYWVAQTYLQDIV